MHDAVCQALSSQVPSHLTLLPMEREIIKGMRWGSQSTIIKLANFVVANHFQLVLCVCVYLFLSWTVSLMPPMVKHCFTKIYKKKYCLIKGLIELIMLVKRCNFRWVGGLWCDLRFYFAPTLFLQAKDWYIHEQGRQAHKSFLMMVYFELWEMHGNLSKRKVTC